MHPKTLFEAIREEARAIKKDPRPLLVVLFVVLLFFLICEQAHAITIFEENFESYGINENLADQLNWDMYQGQPEYYKITNIKANSGIRSVLATTTGSQNIVERYGTALSSGRISFWVWLECIELGQTSDNLRIILKSTWEGNSIDVFFEAKEKNCETLDQDFDVNVFVNITPTKIGEITGGKWSLFEIEWDYSTQKVRYIIDRQTYTGWLDPEFTWNKIERFWLLAQSFSSVGEIAVFIDDIFENPTLKICNVENCDLCYNENDCWLAGCFWHETLEICYTKIYGDCDTGYNLRFCETQLECETKGGFWVADFCWEIEPPTIEDWETYYSEHSKFTTSTSLVSSLVNFTTPIFETAGGWVVALSDIFDVEKAVEKGEQFGEAIPKARGYLATINQFFSGIPISEAFLFFLVISLAIGTFRIIRNIISLVKPL